MKLSLSSLIVFSLSWFLFALLLLGLPVIGSSTEGREAQVISVILRTQEWILPLRNGIVPSKPIFFHWLGAIFAKLFGESNEFTVRFPSLVAATFLLILTGIAASRLLEGLGSMRGSERSKHSDGLFASFILATSYGFARLASSAQVDMVFSLFAFCAIWALIFPIISRPDDLQSAAPLRDRDFLLFYLMCALATLSKGPLGIVLPAIIVGTLYFLLLGLKRSVLLFLRPRLSWLLFLVIVVPWYWASYAEAKGAFIGRQLIFENLTRFIGGENINTEPLWFYIPSFLRSVSPWSAIWIALLFFNRAAIGNTLQRNTRLLPIYAFLIGILFFSISSGKRHSYLLPLYPLFAISLSAEISIFYRNLADDRRARIGAFFGRLYTLIPIVIMLTIFVINFNGWQTFSLGELAMVEFDWINKHRLILNIALLPLFLMSCIALHPVNKKVPFRYITMATLLFFFITLGLALKNSLKGFKEAAVSILAQTGNSNLYLIKESREEHFDPLFFYLQREVTILAPELVGTIPCESLTVAKSIWLDTARLELKQANKGVKELQSYTQLPDLLKSDRSREYKLFRIECGVVSAGSNQVV